MEVKIELKGRDDVADRDRQSVNVETHIRQGEIFNVLKVDTMMENGESVFRVPPGGRLVIQVPEGDNEVVYDAAQGAAVRRGSQQNADEGADKPKVEILPEMKSPSDSKLGQAHSTSTPADKAKAEAEAKAKAQAVAAASHPNPSTGAK